MVLPILFIKMYIAKTILWYTGARVYGVGKLYRICLKQIRKLDLEPEKKQKIKIFTEYSFRFPRNK